MATITVLADINTAANACGSRCIRAVVEGRELFMGGSATTSLRFRSPKV
jgi:hypothetical protein